MMSDRLEGSLIVTYRCNARCNMCNTYRNPTKASEEIAPSVYAKLPRLDFANITGGEPFIRDDLEEIVGVVRERAKRIVISTNGFFHDRILSLARAFPDVGVRVSLEGLPKTNDAIRGIKDGFDRGLRTLVELRQMGLRDVGFGMTVQGKNAADLLALYHLSEQLGMEFATATLHNSHYFFKHDNRIDEADVPAVVEQFERLVDEMLASRSPKKWFRAYFNAHLIGYIQGERRPLPCRMGHQGFFVDPLGAILPCNGMDEPSTMGDLVEQSWEEIWNSERAKEIRAAVCACPKQCWMIGSAAPAMKTNIASPLAWIVRQKFLGRRRRERRGKASCA
jgi:MoaA/NifB/PqqE/SkfB family radical SAM enzyme